MTRVIIVRVKRVFRCSSVSKSKHISRTKFSRALDFPPLREPNFPPIFFAIALAKNLNLTSRLLRHLLNPFAQVLECCSVCDIEAEDDAGGGRVEVLPQMCEAVKTRGVPILIFKFKYFDVLFEKMWECRHFVPYLKFDVLFVSVQPYKFKTLLSMMI